MELQEKILKKVEALLNKTVENGCTPEEAAIAAAKAQELLAKYHLELGERNEKEDVCASIIEESKTWAFALAHVIGENSCCKVMGVKSGRGVKITFIGHETDLNVALELYDKLYLACKKGIQAEVRRCKREKGTSAGAENSYAIGFHEAVKSAMGEQCLALVLVTPEDVKDKTRELFSGYSRTRSRRITVNRDSYENGRRDGRDAAGRKSIAG